MKNQNGFTLTEVLLVLTAFLVLLSFGFTIPVKTIQQHEVSQFLTRFQQDILYLQEWNMYEEISAYMTIDPSKHQYSIRKNWTGDIIIQREIPEYMNIDLRTLKQPIYYTSNGTIKNPGVLMISAGNTSYKITFPFGKGRSYIEKQ